MPIKLSNLNLYSIKQNIKNLSKPSFKGFTNLTTDTFERAISDNLPIYKTDNTLKHVKLQNIKDNSTIDGDICKSSQNRYVLNVDGETKCFMDVLPQNDYLYIDYISRINNTSYLKGAGTELLKFASQKSAELGNGGKLKLCAAASHPFYFKNNLRVPKSPVAKLDHSNELNAALDYAIRTNTDPKKINPVWETGPTMILDEKGAETLAKGIRFIDSSKSQILYSKEINGEIFDMDFCDLGDEFVLQLINKNNEFAAQEFILEGKIVDGRLIPDYNKFTGLGFEDEFNNALKLAQEIYSCN